MRIVFSFIVVLLQLALPATGFDDATGEWRAAAEKLKDGEILSIPKGEYHFGTDGAAKMMLYTSNNGSGVKNVVFPLAGKSNVTIEGNGARLVFHGRTFPFAVTNCRNVTLRNFTVTTRYPSSAGFTVVKKDARGCEVQLADGVCPYRTVDGELEFDLDGSISSTANNKFSLHARDRIAIHYLVSQNTPEDRSKYPTTFVCASARDLGGGRIRFDYAGPWHPMGEEMPFPVGERCVFNLESDRYREAFFFEDCEGVTLENVKIRRFGGMGVVAQRSGDIRISNLEVLPENDEMVTTTADAMHFINCYGSLVIENCRSAYSLDDVLNIHGNYLMVEEVLNNKVKLRAMHLQHQGFFPYRAGDVVEFSEEHSRRIVHTAKIIDCKPDKGDSYVCIIEIDSKSSALTPGLLAENTSLCPNVTLRGNDFRNHPNIRLSGRGKYLIENNRISNSYSALVVLDLAEYWYESGRISEMIIRNNKFVNCNALGGKVFMNFGVSGWGK